MKRSGKIGCFIFLEETVFKCIGIRGTEFESW